MAVTKRLLGALRMADRKCGLAYRSRTEQIRELRQMGLVYVYDRGEHKQVSRFVARTTEAGKRVLREKEATQ